MEIEPPSDMVGASFGEAVVMDISDNVKGGQRQASIDTASALSRSPIPARTRSLSDGGGTPSKLSPSPHIIDDLRRMSKDDSNLSVMQQPVTPRRTNMRGLSVQMPPRQFSPPPPAASNAYVKPLPLSPKLDHSQIYASPTSLLPRRSRGLDFSRAATSLHHSILAENPSPDSSPTIGNWGVNIPGRKAEYGGPEYTSTSLWSMMGNQEKMHVSSSLGSTNNAIASDMSSSSDDDDFMDEDMEEAYVTTPQISKTSRSMGVAGPGGTFGSPAMSSLMSFQQRQRPRKQKKKLRGPLGLGFNLAAAALSKSPPSNSSANARRESISWQANQLRISSGEADEARRPSSDIDGISGDGQRGVVKRAVTRRGNLLPKTKTFARIRAALAEEGAPAESECLREAEVVKQVRESDMDLESRLPPIGLEPNASLTAQSSPNLNNQEPLDDIPGDEIMGDLAMGLSSSFKHQAIKNSKGKSFWDTFSESSSMGGARTPPPPPSFLPRGSSSGMSEDAGMVSPSLAGQPGFPASQFSGPQPPTAAEITRRINNKRRRDDDFDPTSFKRRAVSPSMSGHNSPMMQSPMQRDSAWGSRPGSTAGSDNKGGSSAPSDSGSLGGTPANPPSGSTGRVIAGKTRIGFQGMVDTNDGIMRMSIE